MTLDNLLLNHCMRCGRDFIFETVNGLCPSCFDELADKRINSYQEFKHRREKYGISHN